MRKSNCSFEVENCSNRNREKGCCDPAWSIIAPPNELKKGLFPLDWGTFLKLPEGFWRTQCVIPAEEWAEVLLHG